MYNDPRQVPINQQPQYIGQQPMIGGQPQYMGQQPIMGGQPQYMGQQPIMGGQPQYMGQQPVMGMQPQYMGQQPVMGMQPQYMGQQPMMVVPVGGFQFGGCMMTFSMNPLNELARAKSAIIKQQIELLEIMTGCETPNRYHVYITTNTGEFIYLFKCKEDSECCERQCCSSDARSFNMKVKHINSPSDFMGNDFKSDYFAHFLKPFKCTCCCLQRPVMTVNSGSDYFGKVFEPFNCCDPLFYIYDKSDTLRWKVHTEYCQCGIYCRNGCGKCSDVTFPIYSGDKTIFDHGNSSEGFIKKRFAGFQEIVSDADTFEIVFPVNATPQERLNLIGTVLMIDYLYYEDNGNDKNKHHHY